MSESPVVLTVDEGIARLTLNRPDKLNSINLDTHAALKIALTELEKRDDVRCLWLAANGRAFCVGQDLEERRSTLEQANPDLGESLEKRYNPLIRRLQRLPFPVICTVNGAAAGAGIGLALAADIVIAAESARFIFAFSRLGLVPDAGTSWSLPRLVGRARAQGLVLLGGELSARQAVDWGLIWECVADEALQAHAGELASRLANGPTVGLALCRRALAESQSRSLDEQLDSERDLQRIAGRSADYKEGVGAFFAKRQAHFVGR